MMFSFVFCHGNDAMAEEMVIFLATSSSSKSVMVLPSSTFRCRSVAPAVNLHSGGKRRLPAMPVSNQRDVPNFGCVEDLACINLQRRKVTDWGYF